MRWELQQYFLASINNRIFFNYDSLMDLLKVSIKYQQNEKHFNYTTPKSFLEFIKLYDNLLGAKRKELAQKKNRLENGLQKLKNTASQVRKYARHRDKW